MVSLPDGPTIPLRVVFPREVKTRPREDLTVNAHGLMVHDGPKAGTTPTCVTRCMGRVLCTHAVGAAPRGGWVGCRYDMVRTHFYQSRGKATPQRQEATAGSETGGAPGRVRRGTKEPSSGDGRVLRLGLAGSWHDSGLCTHLSKLTEHKRVNSFSF